ncbi:MAG: hypothetical protein LBD04_01530 [Synergistaceae bacterium]|jgi:hypothetical protein|nr:hypothetical protein [Synergistaceae bacterium]
MKKTVVAVFALLAVAGLEAGAFAAPAPVVKYYYQYDHYGNMQPVPVEYHYEEHIYPVTYYEKRTVLRPRVYRTRMVYNVVESPVVTETAPVLSAPVKVPVIPATVPVPCGCAPVR